MPYMLVKREDTYYIPPGISLAEAQGWFEDLQQPHVARQNYMVAGTTKLLNIKLLPTPGAPLHQTQENPYLVKDQDVYPIQFIHWWPGRLFKKKLPLNLHMFIRKADAQGSIYLTYAYAPGTRAYGCVMCMRTDKPTRKFGRGLALIRLRKKAGELGYELKGD